MRFPRIKSSYKYSIVVPLAIWAAALVLSLTLFFLSYDGMVERVIFFPKYREQTLEGEPRRLPKKGELEKDIQLLIQETVLGPFNIHYDRVLPLDTELESILLREERLYLDFSLDPVVQQEESVLSLSEKIEAVKRTVRFNFPSVELITVTFRGQTPKMEEL
ncbi:MAG: hypothetical protein R6V67_08220 [Spirochaetia bacterium]